VKTWCRSQADGFFRTAHEQSGGGVVADVYHKPAGVLLEVRLIIPPIPPIAELATLGFVPTSEKTSVGWLLIINFQPRGLSSGIAVIGLKPDIFYLFHFFRIEYLEAHYGDFGLIER
jgi:hypothetical protein